jgi:hypothetical protein
VVFRYLTADQRPDHDTIATFRQQHPDTLAGWLPPALPLCQKAGLVKLGQAAIDGSQRQANASRHQAPAASPCVISFFPAFFNVARRSRLACVIGSRPCSPPAIGRLSG